jgi:hypothetical protein
LRATGLDERIIIKWILKKLPDDVDYIRLADNSPVAGSCEQCYKYSGSIEDVELLD